jgi:hypothetical protein
VFKTVTYCPGNAVTSVPEHVYVCSGSPELDVSYEL